MIEIKRRDSMKKIKILLALSLVIFLMACGKKGEGGEAKRLEKGFPDEKQIVVDIDEAGANKIYFSDEQSYSLKTESVTIDKAKKEEKSYIVYCTAKQESKKFAAKNKYILTYNYYEVGGWILDECTIDEINMTPKCGLSKKKINEYISSMGYSAVECIKSKKTSDTSYTYDYSAIIEHPYMDAVYNITVTCEYTNFIGWNITAEESFDHNDWSKVYGKWYTEFDDGDNHFTCTLNVKEINEQQGTIIVDVTTTSSSPYGIKGTNGLSSLTTEDIVAPIEIETTPSGLATGCEYISTIVYYTYNSGGVTYDDAYLLSWGKDIGMYSVFCNNTFKKGFLQKVE